MKEIFIGIGKSCLYMTILVLTFWVLKGFETPTQLEIEWVRNQVKKGEKV